MTLRPRSVATRAYWALPLTINHARAEEVFGAPIPSEAWAQIELAFECHAGRLADLEGTSINGNPHDAKGFAKRHADTTNRLRTALASLEEIDRDFLAESEQAAEAAEYRSTGQLQSLDAFARIGRAMDEISNLLGIVYTAERHPLVVEVPSEAESRKMLARDIYDALKPHGARLSDGRALGELDVVAMSDLTGFEHLAVALGLHKAKSPLAMAKWLRDAVAQ